MLRCIIVEKISFMKTAIQINDLKFSYKRQQPTLDIPSWHVGQGEQLFLYGSSGSGKSTLLNLLSGILPTSSGEIEVFNTALNTLSNRQRDQFRAKNIGYVFQRFNLIPYLTAIDNIRLACVFSDQVEQHKVLEEKIRRLLSELGIDKPHWHKRAEQLSVGQQQRVAIARAMIHHPQLLIVDEPTSSLDHHHRDAFLQLLLRQADVTDLTLIFVSHDQSLSPYFSRSQAIDEINHA